jgi:ribosomal protein S27AE
MKIRPGKTRSLVAGILMLVVMIVGLFMLPGSGALGPGFPMGGAITAFRIAWVAFGLIGAGASFYNAFSQKGMPLYEIDLEGDEGQVGQEGPYCPKCGQPVGRADKFCRNCGAAL